MPFDDGEFAGDDRTGLAWPRPLGQATGSRNFVAYSCRFRSMKCLVMPAVDQEEGKLLA